MKRVKVGDILELHRRQIEVDPVATYEEIGVRSFGRGIFHKDPVHGIDLGKKRVFEIHPGDLVFNNVFAWEGAVALAGDAESNRIGSHRFMTYRPRDAEVSTSYLRYYFTSEKGVELLGMASPGSAGRNRTLAIDRFEAIEIPLPSIREQLQAAAHLDRVATLSSSILHRRQSARIRIDALHASMAGQPQLTEQERKDAGWRYLPLLELMTQSSETIDVNIGEQYPNLGIYSFGRGVFGKPPINGVDTSAKKLNRVRSGQFIYSRLFAFEGAYAFVPDDFDGCFVSNEFPSFDVDPDLANAEFIAAALKSPQEWKILAAMSKGLGVRRQRVQVEALLAHKLWIPPVSEQHRIVRGLRKLDQANMLMMESDALASAIVPSALNRVFAGLG